MSRSRLLASYQDVTNSIWMTRNYHQGAIFRAQRIHRSLLMSREGQTINNDYLECFDEDANVIFLKLDQVGRFSLIAVFNEPDSHRSELYIYSTQMPNIDQFIKRVLFDSTKQMSRNCIRLVRGAVPHRLFCQYFHCSRQRTFRVLTGLTQEGLLIEWNLDSHVPCRYATNIGDILNQMNDTTINATLKTSIRRARTYHREKFQFSMQLFSTHDWTGFFHYWQWTGDIRTNNNMNNNDSDEHGQQYHFIGSIQVLIEIDCFLYP
jgi:hypothetical protein